MPTTTPAPWDFAARWGATGHVTDLDGPVHWVEFGDGESTGRPPLLFVHGLGGSHLNWVRVAPALAAGRRAIALDLPGFGLSPAEGRSTTVEANAHVVCRFVHRVIGEPAVLVGNSMGGMVSVLAAHADPAVPAGLVLVDPSLPVPRHIPHPVIATQFLLYATPRLGEFYLRTGRSRKTSRQLVERVIDLCFANPELADPEVIEAGIALVEERRRFTHGEAWFLEAARSLMRVVARPDRYRRKLRNLAGPVLLISGEQDRLVPIAAARAVARDNPSWETLFLPGVGHTPQLEAPEAVIDGVSAWLSRNVDETVLA